MQNGNFRYAIFDMDGTLTDTMYIWENLSLVFLKKYGIEANADLSDKLGVVNIHKAAEFLKKTFQLPDTQEDIFRKLVAILVEYYQNSSILKPGVKELLTDLRRSGIRTTILSATVLEAVKVSLTQAGIIGFFDHVMSTEDLPHGKNFPETFELVADRLGFVKEQTIVFEDALYAVTGAKKAGFAVCAITDHSARDPEAIRNLADWYIDDFRQFPRELLPK